ncbi:SDR family NAD(P)-dependent oxidoreductase [Rhodococcus globerulus]|uniref:SDR family NAD(P)-dependent oxidoreductase n=1 Tax=Rhodococcus globerulus TaxID=33008 RepID=A0ABU4C4A6_RHOGO|nr:SDR family NAD(P)-dependent oxidoreductase [Rhodococcus globerulus]MDV6271332.1 SDR family NAD(P)-dependent oxidoreductase [Rhodococcus globerulus]
MHVIVGQWNSDLCEKTPTDTYLVGNIRGQIINNYYHVSEKKMELSEGQVGVVTGAGSGIGLAIAEALGRRGAKVVLSDIDEKALSHALQSLTESGVQAVAIPTDVTDAQAVEDLATSTLREFGRIDIVVNNAGTIGKCLPVWEFELVEWEWILKVDLWGVIHGIRSFLPYLVEQGSGYVVNMSSMAGLSTVAQLAPYAAAKHAVVSVSETLWTDLQERAPGVGVTVVCPGPTLTRLMTEGERNRPAHLRPNSDKGIAPQLNPATFAASSTSMFMPEQVAEATIEAMRKNQLYLVPNPGSLARIDRRLDRIRSEVMEIQIDPGAKVNSLEVFKDEIRTK